MKYTKKLKKKHNQSIRKKPKISLAKLKKMVGGTINCDTYINKLSMDTVGSIERGKFFKAFKNDIGIDIEKLSVGSIIYNQVNALTNTVTFMLTEALKSILDDVLEGKDKQLMNVLLNYVTASFYDIKWDDNNYFDRAKDNHGELIQRDEHFFVYEEGSPPKESIKSLETPTFMDVYKRELDSESLIRKILIKCLSKDSIKKIITNMLNNTEQDGLINTLHGQFDKMSEPIAIDFVNKYKNFLYSSKEIVNNLKEMKLQIVDSQ